MAANTYAWDLGFDWTALADPSLGTRNGNDLYYLQHGFVNVTTLKCGIPVNLQQGDIIRFTIYDVTPGASVTSKYQIAPGSVISFMPAETGQPQSPFSASRYDISPGSSNDPVGDSVIFGKFPAWDTITPEPISVKSGRYLMSITLNVTDDTTTPPTTKTYSVDPEMVIGSDG